MSQRMNSTRPPLENINLDDHHDKKVGDMRTDYPIKEEFREGLLGSCPSKVIEQNSDNSRKISVVKKRS